jgi:pyridoxamine 5'-phosphate oxidase family protein
VVFTEAEIKYLREHPLGRLATIGPDGAPQVHPIAFWVDWEIGVLKIGGPELAKSQKFRNVRADSRVSLVVDDQSETPNPIGQTGRGIEIRGEIEIVNPEEPLVPGFSTETMHLYPKRIISWNIEEFQHGYSDGPSHMRGYNSRDVTPS